MPTRVYEDETHRCVQFLTDTGQFEITVPLGPHVDGEIMVSIMVDEPRSMAYCKMTADEFREWMVALASATIGRP